jgi:UDP-GlcNAc:undecaprenyl-phosphate/decaprenyl-phosphate GlcNAc-1-phosphate transferase
VREYLTVFLVAAVVTYLLGVVAREIALRTGAVARVRDRDVHAVPIPYFGGVAMLGGLASAYLVAHRLPFLSLSDRQVFHDSGVVLIGGAMICVLGVFDDLFELDALTKLGGQVLAAAFLVVNQVQYFSFQLPGRSQFSLTGSQSALLSVVVVVATVNAVNFVDGLDGLAAGVVAIGAVAFFAFAYKLADANKETLAISAALLCAALGGACVGFLPHNFFPARIFMGDSGSMLIGLMLSGSALTLTGQFANVDLTQGAGGTQASLLPTLLPIVLPISILIVPFSDLVLAVIRRTRAGRSPFAPDKEHLHHRLLEIGHSHRRAVLIMWLWAGLIAFGGVLASLYASRLTLALLAVWLVLTVVLTFVVPRVQRPDVPRWAGTPR